MRFRQHQDQARSATRRLLLLFLLTVVLTVVAVNLVLGLLWRLQSGGLLDFPRWFFETNSAVAAGFILCGSWLETLQLRQGGAHVAQMVGGRELLVNGDGHERRLRNIVQEIAIASGLRPPRVFVLPRDDSINAFAAGWEQNDSVIAVTRGALERLDRDELQGVVAHEFSHILNGDARLNMRLIGHVWGLQLLFMLGRDMVDATDAAGRRTLLALLGLGLMAVGSIGWFAGRLLKAAVSRQREFLADAAAVQYTRLPGGIGGALRKIAGQQGAGQPRVRSARAEAISHMLLASDIFAGGGALATHPPLAERVRRIYGRAMAPLPSEALAAPVEPAPAASPLAYTMPAFGAADAGAPALPHAVADAAAGAGASGPGAGSPWLDELLAIAWPQDLASATLAYMVRPGVAVEQQVWRGLFADLGAPAQDRLLGRVWSEPASAHQPGFERLLTRCAALPLAQRSALRRQAHRIVQADGRLSMPELWRCLALDHLLGLRRESVLRETHCLSLQQCAGAIAALSAVLASQLRDGQAGSAAAQARWCAGVIAALGLDPAAADPARPSLAGIHGAVRRLARLAWMSRPQLMKAWCAQALGAGAAAPQDLCDALRTLCLLIDTPMPPDLQARYPAPSLAA